MSENNNMAGRARFVVMGVASLVVLRAITRRRGAKPPRKPKRTILIGADLTGALLTNAQWAEAMIVRSILKDANLTGANLQKASLQRVDLRGANLTGADLQGAKLQGVVWDKTSILPDGTAWSRKAKVQRFTDAKRADFWQLAPAETAAEA